ncbi:DegQ family serine endoprotease [Candidatus Uabimicrobium amorphum]|uniref:MucD n=1 Tax=Uabimicrobium amorphum TaxID=2596890 RepID=A0A5S9IKP0_UABAM|nr:DegQ family serine endoprotease [Candidatus Uabimicrobium amorphum]BBM83474.1 MucD [Candidatus Uabimicrobium amorphum]
MRQKIFIMTCVIAIMAVGVIAFHTPSIQADDSQDAAIAKLHQQSQAFVQVAKRTTPAVVHIAVVRKVSGRNGSMDFFRNHPFFRDNPRSKKAPRQRKEQGAGSGVIIDPRGYILSNHHVVKNAEEVTVTLNDRRKFKAKVIGSDSKTDVAVIKIEAKNLPVAPLGNSSSLQVGQWVLAIGNPFGLSQTVTAGIVSAKGRSGVGITEYEDFIQTDAAINPGNSGGPLINLHGEVIGINTAILSRSGGYQGIGFAIPVNQARTIMKQIIASGKVQRSWLGVQIEEVTPDMAQAFGLNEAFGCLVQQIFPNSPARKAGIRSGDIILYFNGKKITRSAQLRNTVATTPAGSKVPVEIFRNQKRKTIYVVLGDIKKATWNGQGTQPQPQEQPTQDSAIIESLGIEIQQLTPDLAEALGVQTDKGVVITAITDGSAASRSSLRTNDVISEINRMRIRTISDAKKVLSQQKQLYLFRVITGVSRRYVVVKGN